ERHERERALEHRRRELRLSIAQERAAELEEALRIVRRVRGAIEELRRPRIAALAQHARGQPEQAFALSIRVALDEGGHHARPRGLRARLLEEALDLRLELARRLATAAGSEHAAQPAHRPNRSSGGQGREAPVPGG